MNLNVLVCVVIATPFRRWIIHTHRTFHQLQRLLVSELSRESLLFTWWNNHVAKMYNNFPGESPTLTNTLCMQIWYENIPLYPALVIHTFPSNGCDWMCDDTLSTRKWKSPSVRLSCNLVRWQLAEPGVICATNRRKKRLPTASGLLNIHILIMDVWWWNVAWRLLRLLSLESSKDRNHRVE